MFGRRRTAWAWGAALACALVLSAGCEDGDGDGGGTPLPQITSHPADQTVTEGETATFSVTAADSDSLTYQWQRSDDGGSTWTDISGATSSDYTTPATTLADDGARFSCVVGNAAGSVESNTATMTVNMAPPEITSHPADQTVTEGEAATFSVTVTGSGSLTYQWQRSDDGGSTWTDISGATSSDYTTPATTLADDGAQFSCVVGNAAGSVESNTATMTVNMAPPEITSHPADQVVGEGESATFTVAATGSGTLTYQWEKDGVDISGATSSSYTTPPAAFGDLGSEFTCVVANAGGSVESDPAVLVVHGTVTFDLDGVAQDYSLASMAVADPTFKMVAGGPSLSSAEPAIAVCFGGGTGTYKTGSGFTNMVMYIDSAGWSYMGWDLGGSYSITVTTYEGVGGRTTGTFSGTVVDLYGMSSHVITNGYFDVGVLAP